MQTPSNYTRPDCTVEDLAAQESRRIAVKLQSFLSTEEILDNKEVVATGTGKGRNKKLSLRQRATAIAVIAILQSQMLEFFNLELNRMHRHLEEQRLQNLAMLRAWSHAILYGARTAWTTPLPASRTNSTQGYWRHATWGNLMVVLTVVIAGVMAVSAERYVNWRDHAHMAWEDNEELTTQLNSAHETIMENESEITRLTSKAEGDEEVLNVVRTENARLIEQLTRAQDDSDSTEANAMKLQEENANLKAALAAANLAVSDWKSRHSAVEQRAITYENMKREVDVTLLNTKRELQDLKDEMAGYDKPERNPTVRTRLNRPST